jgi:UDP-N-acetylmuramoyl-tripeptide--D-alanyl-D-alanine ligase
VMIKSSKSIGFVKIVNALLKKYAVSEAAE